MPASTPDQCNIQLIAAINARDIESVMALYEPEATFIVEPGRVLHGTAQIREAMLAFIGTQPDISVEVPIVIESGDIALTQSKWALKGTGLDGSLVDISGAGSEVLRRQPDGTWKFILDNPWGVP